MKRIKYIMLNILLCGCLFSCSDDWNNHYNEQEQVLNNEKISIVNATSTEYLRSNTDLSSIYALFNETGIIKRIEEREQLFTVFVINNSIQPTALSENEEKTYLAESHISNVAISPANLSDGQRMLMWNGKYINVQKSKNEDGSDNISFNNAKVKRVIKVNNGFVYELDSYISSPKSMFEVIQGLSDKYSTFRNMILSKNKRVFDKANSLPIGVDNTGSTIYDSIFVVTNPFFTNRGLDIMSESISATMFIPSNDIFNEAVNTAKANLASWNLVRDDSIIRTWIIQATFFNNKITKENYEETQDLNSVFGKQWRTAVQKVDLDNPIPLSNGVAYYVKSMKIPTNVLIYRLKDYMRWYEFLTDSEKSEYFASTNLTFDKCETKVTGWSGWPQAGFPLIENRVVRFTLTDKSSSTPSKAFKLNFKAFQYKESNGIHTVTPYLIPPGVYDLCLGFEQKLGHDIKVSVNGELINTITTSQLTSTTFHYDRGGQGYPEGYDTSLATDSKKGNYDRDGGKIGVITVTGDKPIELIITFEGVNVSGGKTCFHHWCLRPTKDCY